MILVLFYCFDGSNHIAPMKCGCIYLLAYFVCPYVCCDLGLGLELFVYTVLNLLCCSLYSTARTFS